MPRDGDTPGRLSVWWRYGGVILGMHILAGAVLLHAVRGHPVLWGLGLLAYSLGLRHAFDADHIAAIDNTVRRLSERRGEPAGVGLYFSLGHSTIVLCMTLVAVAGVRWSRDAVPAVREVGAVLGPAVSAAFLLCIGTANLLIWINLYRLLRDVRRGRHDGAALDRLLERRGFVALATAPLLRMIERDWHIYPIGCLFGLGFDTASEIALLAVSAGAAASAVPLDGVLALPLLFAAGMSALDTADGLFMTSAYRWAVAAPVRRLYYNLVVTAVSVLAAFVIGVAQLSQVTARRLPSLPAALTTAPERVFSAGGYLLVAIFMVTWSSSYAAWRLQGRFRRRRNMHPET